MRPPLCFTKDLKELLRSLRVHEASADRFAPHEPRNAAQRLDVCSRLRLRARQQEKEANRFTIDGFIGHRRTGRPGDRKQIGQCRGFAVRDELPLPFEDRLKDIVRGSVASHEQVDQFPEHTLLALGP